MKLSEKVKIFSQFFTAFLNSTFNFEHFEKKDESHSLCLSEIVDCEIDVYLNVKRIILQYAIGQSTS